MWNFEFEPPLQSSCQLPGSSGIFLPRGATITGLFSTPVLGQCRARPGASTLSYVPPVFVLQMVFLDDSGGNKTLRKWEHWRGGAKLGSSRIISLQTGFNGKQSIEANERLLSLKY